MATTNAARSDAARNWYLPLILGILFILVGVWVLFTPAESFLALAVLFAVAFLISGLLDIWYAFSIRDIVRGWGWTLAGGIAELIIGLLLITRIEITVVVLTLFVGFAFLCRSIMAIVWSIELQKMQVSGWGGLLAIGILGLVVAFILLWNPLVAGLTVVVFTAIAFIIIGALQVHLSLRLRQLRS